MAAKATAKKAVAKKATQKTKTTSTAKLAAAFATRHGAANLGIRPSFDPPIELLEPYFFDFDGDLYGQEIEVALHHYLRPEAKFDTLEALTAQMEADCSTARSLLGG